MYNVITIADAILKIAKEAGRSLTPMQLMKLVYIAHGWSLGLGRGDLFQDRIEAWKYGPVIPDLYHATKVWGRAGIPFDRIVGKIEVDKDTEKFLREVFGKYGNMNGITLSNLTHKSDTPWDQVYREGVFNIEIPDSVIEAHYKKLLHERSPNTPASQPN